MNLVPLIGPEDLYYNSREWECAECLSTMLPFIKLDNEDFHIVLIENTLTPNFVWACANVDKIINRYFKKRYIIIFPFSSPKLNHKQWPYYNELIKMIKSKYRDIEIVLAPGKDELELAKQFDATIITNDKKPLNLRELAGLIKKSQFVIANDTGPAHMAAHLGKSGLVLFGYHTSAKKVSIETDNFKPITVNKLKDLSVTDVYNEFKKNFSIN